MTDDYTPTINDVREMWAEYQDRTWGRFEDHQEEFDRFIRKVKAEAWDEGSYARAENMAREIWEDGDILLNPYED